MEVPASPLDTKAHIARMATMFRGPLVLVPCQYKWIGPPTLEELILKSFYRDKYKRAQFAQNPVFSTATNLNYLGTIVTETSLVYGVK